MFATILGCSARGEVRAVVDVELAERKALIAEPRRGGLSPQRLVFSHLNVNRTGGLHGFMC